MIEGCPAPTGSPITQHLHSRLRKHCRKGAERMQEVRTEVLQNIFFPTATAIALLYFQE